MTLVAVPTGVTDPTEAAAGRPFGAGWPHPATPIALSYSAAGGENYLVIGPSGAVIGDCGTKGPPSPDGIVEIGYGLAAPSWGRGFGSAAVAALLDRLAGRADVRTVEAHVATDNVASRRVLQRLDFAVVGTTDSEVVYQLELGR